MLRTQSTYPNLISEGKMTGTSFRLAPERTRLAPEGQSDSHDWDFRARHGHGSISNFGSIICGLLELRRYKSQLQGWSVNSSSADMLSWLKGSSTESAIRKLENGLAASAAKRARVDSKLQEQREIEARARKEIADAHVRPLTEHEDAALDTELDDLMPYVGDQAWMREKRNTAIFFVEPGSRGEPADCSNGRVHSLGCYSDRHRYGKVVQWPAFGLVLAPYRR